MSAALPHFSRRADVYVLRWSAQQSLRHSTLISTVPRLSLLSTWRLCDGRGAAEIEIRADKQGLKLPKRRKREMAAQMILILLTDIAHTTCWLGCMPLPWLTAITPTSAPCA